MKNGSKFVKLCKTKVKDEKLKKKLTETTKLHKILIKTGKKIKREQNF